MKKIFSILFVMFSILSFGQEVENNNQKSKKCNPYVAVGLSVSNSDNFMTGSYPSLEVGLMGENISTGLVLGRSNLKGMFKNSDIIDNYFVEIKNSICVPVNNSASIYGLFGIGTYGSFKHVFVEYGAGLGYSFCKMTYCVQASNWDGVWYTTPGLVYNF